MAAASLMQKSIRIPGSRWPKPAVVPLWQMVKSRRGLSTSIRHGVDQKPEGVQLTHSYYHSLTTTPLQGITIGQKLQQTVEKFPDREMLVFKKGNVRRTFEQFFEECDRLAAGFVALGLKKGDRVGMWGPNTLEWVLTQFATARAGLILVTINPAYQVNELKHALWKVGCRAIVSSNAYKTQDYYKILHQICPELETCKPGELRSKNLPLLETVIMLGEEKLPGTFSFPEVMEMGDHAHRRTVLEMQGKLQFDDPINIQFTSGTTGAPKGVTQSHHSLLNNLLYIGHRLGYHDMHHKICLSVPLFHIFGSLGGTIASAMFGTTVVAPSPSFEPEACLQAIQEESCTSIYGTPTMYINMLNHPHFDKYSLASLDTGIMGGSPCPMEVMKQVISKMHCKGICVGFGATESCGMVFMGYKSDSLERKVGTIGYPCPQTEVKIVDAQGKVTRVNEPGELYTRGFHIMLGYWDDAEKTAEVLGPDRWYRTGDLAIMDEEGYGQIVGRIKDTIIRGGENIYPGEIEEFLYTHPKVEDVQVIGLPDDRMGEEVCALIKLKEGEKLTEDDVKAFCKGQISHYKIPRYIRFVTEFPLTVSGKVQKYKLREEVSKDLGLLG